MLRQRQVYARAASVWIGHCLCDSKSQPEPEARQLEFKSITHLEMKKPVGIKFKNFISKHSFNYSSRRRGIIRNIDHRKLIIPDRNNDHCK